MSDTVEGLQEGSHTDSVARLDLNGIHAMSRQVTGPVTPGVITQMRRSLTRAATSTLGRVTSRVPKRRFKITTGVMFSADNRAFVCAVIQRVR